MAKTIEKKQFTLQGRESWVDIAGYEGRYQVSSEGRIKSLERTVMRKNGKKQRVGQLILKTRLDIDGYPIVNLWSDGVQKTYKVHRIVAESLVPNPENKQCVNHINGIKSDNRIENLEWVTYSENSLHAWENNLTTGRSKAVIDSSTGVLYKSGREAAKSIGVKYDHLKKRLCGRIKNKTSLKYI